jgi:hypothetical protein
MSTSSGVIIILTDSRGRGLDSFDWRGEFGDDFDVVLKILPGKDLVAIANIT